MKDMICAPANRTIVPQASQVDGYGVCTEALSD